VIAIATAMASLFVLSYSLALGRPSPHHIPTAVVGATAAHPRLVAALERETEGGLRLEAAPTVEAAKAGIEAQRVYAALVLDRSPPQLLLASASGTSVARLLQQAAGRASLAVGTPLAVEDVKPLPPADPQGLVSFYVTLAATILGFVTMFQLRAHASQLSLRSWLAAIAVLACVGGLVLALFTVVVIAALRGPFLEVATILAAQIATAALFNATMLTLLGRWAIIPTWGLFVAVGNASSGGAVAPPLLPTFYGVIGRFLPPGATVETIRNAVYFPGAQHLEPVVVEAIWFGASLVALLAVARVRGRTPGTG
jgi:FtsH-binding integral membrane protein